MTELSKLSDEALQKEIESGRKTVSRLEALDSHEVVRTGRADAVLSEMQAAADAIKAARAEVARRTEAKSGGVFNRRAWEIERYDRWANDPNPTEPRGKNRRKGPDPCEPALKAFWLYRSSVPRPLEYTELDASLLTEEEGKELHELALRARKGALSAGEVPRVDALFEKAAGKEPGTIEAHEKFLAERRAQEEEQDAAWRAAEWQAELNRERRLAAMGVPAPKGGR